MEPNKENIGHHVCNDTDVIIFFQIATYFGLIFLFYTKQLRLQTNIVMGGIKYLQILAHPKASRQKQENSLRSEQKCILFDTVIIKL